MGWDEIIIDTILFFGKVYFLYLFYKMIRDIAYKTKKQDEPTLKEKFLAYSKMLVIVLVISFIAGGMRYATDEEHSDDSPPLSVRQKIRREMDRKYVFSYLIVVGLFSAYIGISMESWEMNEIIKNDPDYRKD